MASQPSTKKQLLYRGAFYEPVELPTSLVYRGVVYSAVHKMVTAADPKVPGGPPIPPLNLQQLEQSAGEWAARFAPLPEAEPFVDEVPSPEDEPSTEEDELPKDETEIAENLRPLVALLNDKIKQQLRTYKIAASGDSTIEADEADGVDVVVPIAAGNFAAMPKTRLSFDYAINYPKGTKDEDKRVPEDIADRLKSDGFIKSLLFNIKNLGSANVALGEVIFYFCRHGFAGTGNTVKELLSTVGYLQNVDEVRPGHLLTLPVTEEGPGNEESNAAKVREWAAEMFKDIIQNDMHQDAGVAIYRKDQWGTKEKMKEVLSGLEAHNILGADQVKILTGVVDSFKGEGDFSNFIRESLTPSVKTEKLGLRKVIEDTVKKLTSHERYSGGVKFGVHDDGSIIANIDAPYPFQYVFEPVPGGKIRLKDASVEICDFSFIEHSEEGARNLLSASLNLADAYKRAVNPTLSENRKERDIAELFKKINDYTKLMRQKEEEEAKKEAPPTGPEGVGTGEEQEA